MSFKDTVYDLVKTVARLEEVMHRLRVDIPDSIKELNKHIQSVEDDSQEADRLTLNDSKEYASDLSKRIEARIQVLESELRDRMTTFETRLARIEGALAVIPQRTPIGAQDQQLQIQNDSRLAFDERDID